MRKSIPWWKDSGEIWSFPACERGKCWEKGKLRAKMLKSVGYAPLAPQHPLPCPKLLRVCNAERVEKETWTKRSVASSAMVKFNSQSPALIFPWISHTFTRAFMPLSPKSISYAYRSLFLRAFFQRESERVQPKTQWKI